MTSVDLSGSYKPSVPGALVLSDARSLRVGSDRVTAEVYGRSVAVFVGLKLIYEGPLPVALTERSQVNPWVAQYVLQNQDETKETVVTSENLTDQPSSWVVEGTDDNAPDDGVTQRPEPGSVTVTVSDTAALIRTLETAGFAVSVRRFPGMDKVSYIQASRPGSYLSFRAANANEPTPARTADFVKIDAESYRYLADSIAETMTDPNPWDGDDAEPYILVQYVKWLANGKPVDEDGYPDKREDAAAGQPDVTAALAGAVSALDLAESYFDDPDGFRLSMQGVLERVRDELTQVRDALTGRRNASDPDGTDSEPEPHVHFFPLPPDAATDPAMEPGDCECGTTFAEHMANPDGQTQTHPIYNPGEDEPDSVAEMDVNSAYPTTARGVYGAWQNAPDDVCRYSMAHALEGIQAVTWLDCEPIGQVPACQACADFYNRAK